MRRAPNSSRDGTAPPLPLAGEGRGEGVSAAGQSPRGESPLPALRADLSRKRERLQRTRGEPAVIDWHISPSPPAIITA
ncbi:hypothetical protein C7U92_25155 [Bradyrhizobium sp. WBOS7]|uniref:Uncharacterized protein n=1 Tax=Bradyrhizobium betae TaxID=244734 RepID=A0AAE9NEL3_9BRAD|nr:hypothetical protein [Bradyrhizobium sp. WBOS2]MDD1574036.1 hypothetical protein [Bradyrhizobium sp. WBOS1]MDD1579986.1 hypothetical protein [Bradyrhizobium sp. WBOS7]MDD1604293.1 hypothetical protein [Bradyrhizobium sp. WBOS16]UUO38604.1 hypothetical protein DCK84_31120 [Bradyrhizobium sp. WBOS01]UUO44772.1 hypothetical protein DCM75_31095 [Bradyrhizobium sp. WBOS02]UUO55179.1 hypothetical protein DCM79_20690 [Bradyrhizobium sp. WBOS07]UUO69236.1 hypothetical protein DCM83_31140 [Bradyrh